MSKKPVRKPARRASPAQEPSIRITGDVKDNIGVVIGGGSADVQINSPAARPAPPRSNTARLLIARVAALLLGVTGILAAVALFIRLSAGFDPLTTLLLVLAALIAVLGVIGALKPESVYQLFKGILERR